MQDRNRGAPIEEIEVVYRRRYRDFVRVARAITGNEQAAADAVHDAFVRAVRNRGGFRGSSSVTTWLWRIVVNAARRQRNRDASVFATDPLVLNELAESRSNGSSGRDEHARALLAGLADQERLVLFLRHYADLTYDEIAEAVGIAPGTVAATLHAARAKLRAQLEREEEPCRH